MSIRVLELSGSPRDIGRAHGEALREQIRELAELRLELVRQSAPRHSKRQLLELAAHHREPLDVFDPMGAEELEGIAEGSGVEWEKVLVLNAYTDFRDAAVAWRGSEGGAGIEQPLDLDRDEGCTVVHSPGSRLLAQTWDMHGTAEPYVLALKVRPTGAPSCAVFTVAGCVGMAGVNQHGLACTINNLRSDDGRVGVSWPSLVRRVLRESNARDALHLFDDNPAGSGHHYLIADALGDAWSIETSGTEFRYREVGAEPMVHTNHYLECELRHHEVPYDGSTSHERLERSYRLLAAAAGGQDMEALKRVLGDHAGYPRSVCSHLADTEPDKSKTCGALIADLRGGVMWATRGCAHEATFTRIEAA